MKRIGFLILLYGLGMALAAQSSQGETMYVAVKQAHLKSTTGFFASSRGYLEYGDSVTVLRKTGKWVEIRSQTNPSRTGWTALLSLTSKRITGSSGGALAREIALAGKGFNADVEAVYKKETGAGYEAIDRLESQSLPDEELRRFLREGRLAEGE